MTLLWILIFAVLGSVGGVAGAASVLLFPEKMRAMLVPYLVSYATGALLAAALLGLLPHAIEQQPAEMILATVLIGLCLFFVFERIVIWRHCHVVGHCDVHKSSAYMILVGDALHNFVDGIMLAAAFLSSVPLGIAAGLAVIAHELPQEVGDFAILLDGGLTRRRALLWNLLSSLPTLPGALLAYFALSQTVGYVPYVLAIAAASFLYIGLADLVPGLQGRIGPETGWKQFLLILTGIGTILMVRHAHN